MTSTKNRVFDPPPVHMRPHGLDPPPLVDVHMPAGPKMR